MKIQTNITRNYIPDWTVQDAMRELVQNAIDSDPESWHIVLSPIEGSSRYSCSITTSTELPIAALYMGESSKRDNPDAIGTHGEGLKLAILVLLREGREPDIHSSYYIAPGWEDSLGLEILSFDCTEVSNYVGGTMIEFECTAEEFAEFNSLHLAKDHPFGIVPNSSDCLYVGGLKIASMNYKHSYNLKPSQISLERDRRVSDPYALAEAIARIWCDTERWDYIAEGLLKEVHDFSGFSAIEAPEPLLEACVKLANKMESAPVTYSQQLSGYRGTYVSHSFYSVYSQSGSVRTAYRVPQPNEIIAEWFKTNRSYFRKAGAKRMAFLIAQSKKWKL